MSVGAQLRASREARGLSIDAVAHATRVQPRILAAIERDDVSAVPPRPFGRGFVRSYAREIGLDPDATARDYFAQFAPPTPALPAPEPARAVTVDRLPRPSSSVWAVVSFCAALGFAIALLVGRTPARPAVAPAITPVGTSGSSAAPAPADAPAPAPALPSPAPRVDGLSVVLTATRPSWVTARADGRRVLYQKVLPGTPQTITATRDIELRVGDAGALRWQINGRDAGELGRPGQVRDVHLTPATAATAR